LTSNENHFKFQNLKIFGYIPFFIFGNASILFRKYFNQLIFWKCFQIMGPKETGHPACTTLD